MNTKYAGKLGDQLIALGSCIKEVEGIPSYKIVDFGIILPRKFKKKGPYQGVGGVVDKTGCYINESSIYDLDGKQQGVDDYKLAFGGAYKISSIKKRNKTAIYLGLANKQWGHFIIDNIQRLWFPLAVGLVDPQKRLLNIDAQLLDNYEFVYAGTGQFGNEFTGNYKAFFELLGIDVSKVKIINEVTEYDTVIVPSVAIYPGRYIYSIIRDIFDIVVENALSDSGMFPQKKNKIFFSRSHLPNQRELGAESIEEAFKTSGFEILFPEELTLKEQIFYWNTASEVACINGTIPHNAVFAHDNLKLYVVNKMSKVVGYQSTIDKIWQGTPIYISAYKEPFKRYPLTVSSGPYWLVMNENMVLFFKDEFHIEIQQTDDGPFMFKYLLICLETEIKLKLRWVKRKMTNIIKRGI